MTVGTGSEEVNCRFWEGVAELAAGIMGPSPLSKVVSSQGTVSEDDPSVQLTLRGSLDVPNVSKVLLRDATLVEKFVRRSRGINSIAGPLPRDFVRLVVELEMFHALQEAPKVHVLQKDLLRGVRFNLGDPTPVSEGVSDRDPSLPGVFV